MASTLPFLPPSTWPGLTVLCLRKAALVQSLFAAQRAVILQASTCAKPATEAIFQGILEPIAKGIGEVNTLKDNNRRNRDLLNHLSAVAEGMPAIAWLTQVSFRNMTQLVPQVDDAVVSGASGF